MPNTPTDGLTELEAIEPTRIDGVEAAASGFPVLLMKSVVTQEYPGCGCCENCDMDMSKAVNSQGGINEKPDIDGAEGVLQDIARLIQSEAAEMAVGNWSELSDIRMLCEAASLMCWFRQCEIDGDMDDGLEKALATFVAKRKVSADERKSLAGAGHALSDGSYPIANAEDLHNAAVLARSGHGDVAAAKRLIARRAKELGVANPLADNAQKDTEESVTEETSAATEPQADDLAKADVIKAAITEAMQPLKDDLEAVKADVAKVLDMPIPGGPVQTVPASIRAQRIRDEELAKAARYDRLAEDVTEHDLRTHYQNLAAQARRAATAA